MAFGFGFGFAKNYVVATLSAFNPTSLFAAGETGVYFDPNNSATLFEDAAGTIPTALERPVGAMLDLRDTAYSTYFDGTGDYLKATIPSAIGTGDFTYEAFVYINAFPGTYNTIIGNRDNATNNVAQLGLGYRNDGVVYTYNSGLLGSSTGTVTTGVWYHIACSRQSSTLRIFVNGVLKATGANSNNLSDTLFSVGAVASGLETANAYISNARVIVGTALYTANFTPPTAPLTAVSGTSLLTCGTNWSGNPLITAVGDTRVDPRNPFKIGTGNHATSSSTARPTLTRRVNQFVNSDTLATQSVTTRATTQTLRFEGTGTITLSGTATGVYAAGAYSVTTTAGTLTATVSGTVTRADLREANFGVGLPAYQSVGDTAINAADYDTTGFPAWLRCSGGQSMVTPSINFTGTDKMTVWAGVRKLSESSGMISELSAISDTSAGTFALTTLAAGKMYWTARGSVPTGDIQPSGFVAPTTNVLTGIGDIAGDVMQLRSNGARVATSSQDRGTGNYGNYPLYLFARNQASLFFNGLAGPIIVRGAQSSAAEIANAENWINAQQKVY